MERMHSEGSGGVLLAQAVAAAAAGSSQGPSHSHSHSHSHSQDYGDRPGTANRDTQSGEFGNRSNLTFDGKRMRKPVHRRTVDYTSTVVKYIQVRMWQRDVRDAQNLQPTPSASVDVLPAVAYPDNPSTSFATKFVHPSTNKVRCSINRVLWTPTGRRLITGSQSGEFTLWNGLSFNFEMILQAHDLAVRSMVWSHNENWMVTGDDGGCIKYWLTNMNNVKANKTAHKEAVRDLSFSSTDLKFVSCSDDTTVKVWDFARCQEERSLAGHGWDVKSVDWHPQKSLLVSGGKDNLVKLWDAKTGRELSTLHGHKNTVLSVKWNSNGNWVITASRDQTIKLYDLRTLKELESYKGHRKEVTSLAWHPFHEELFVSGSYDGSIIHWLVGHENPQAEVANAHESSVWDLAWHPMGHLLCSGSNDHTTKFWCRNRPGDSLRDCRQTPSHAQGHLGDHSSSSGGRLGHLSHVSTDGPVTPGAFAAGGQIRGDAGIPGVGMALPLPHMAVHQPIDQLAPAAPVPDQDHASVGTTPSNSVSGNPLPPPPIAPYPAAAAGALIPIQQQPGAHLQLQHQQQMQMQNLRSGMPPGPPTFPQQIPGLPPPHMLPQTIPGLQVQPSGQNRGGSAFGQGSAPLPQPPPPPMRQMVGPSPPMGLPTMSPAPGNLVGVPVAMGAVPFPGPPAQFGNPAVAPPMQGSAAFQGGAIPGMVDMMGHPVNVGIPIGMPVPQHPPIGSNSGHPHQ